MRRLQLIAHGEPADVIELNTVSEPTLGQERDQENTGAMPTSHRMSPASPVAEATASRAIPRSKHGLDLAYETGSAVVTWIKTKYRYPLSPRFFPVSLLRKRVDASRAIGFPWPNPAALL
jgi:hypothetical protein